MSWMVVMGIGVVLGLAALVGIGWSLMKLEAPKKWGALIASLAVGAGGAFLVTNATAIGSADSEGEEVQEMEDFDAPLDDDWGDEGWGDEGWGDGTEGDEAEATSEEAETEEASSDEATSDDPAGVE